MANANSTKPRLIRAAGCIRMSSSRQERSPAQQKGEINKPGPEARPGFRDLLEAAEAGLFEVLLVENGDRIVRRLSPGETVRIAGHHVCHVATEDKDKLAALRYMFTRFADSQISYQALAFEVNDKGFPSPRGNGWGQATVSAILRNPIYRGSPASG